MVYQALKDNTVINTKFFNGILHCILRIKYLNRRNKNFYKKEFELICNNVVLYIFYIKEII